jgi:hypothetical protein
MTSANGGAISAKVGDTGRSPARVSLGVGALVVSTLGYMASTIWVSLCCGMVTI